MFLVNLPFFFSVNIDICIRSFASKDEHADKNRIYFRLKLQCLKRAFEGFKLTPAN
jgi:hypothetical protein